MGWEEIIEDELLLMEEQMCEEQGLEAALLRRHLRELSTLQPACTLEQSATVRDAMTLMQQARSSCVMVLDHGHLVGVFTERDVLTRVASQGMDVDRTPVRVCMTPHPTCLSPDDELVYALHEMSLSGFRHIPLLNEQKRPIALVSMETIVAYLVERFPQAIWNLPPSPAHSWPRTREGA